MRCGMMGVKCMPFLQYYNIQQQTYLTIRKEQTYLTSDMFATPLSQVNVII